MKKEIAAKTYILLFLIIVMVASDLYNSLWMAKRMIAMQSIGFDLHVLAYPALLAYGLFFAKNKYLKKCFLLLLSAVLSYDLACIMAGKSRILSTVLLSAGVILHIPVIIFAYRYISGKEEIRNRGTE